MFKISFFKNTISIALLVSALLVSMASHAQSDDLMENWETYLTYKNSGQWEESLPFIKKCVLLIQESDSRETEDYIICLNLCGVTFSNLGEPDSAEVYFEEAYRIAPSVLASDHLWLGLTYGNMGYSLYIKNEFQQADSVFRKGYAISRIHKRENIDNYNNYVTNLNLLALTNYQLGNYIDALSFYDELLEESADIEGEESITYSLTLSSVALCLTELGRYSESLEFGQECLALFKVINLDNPSEYARLYNTIGLAHYRLGNLKLGLDYFNQSIAICEEIFPPTNFYFVTMIQNKALLLSDLGLLEEADELLQAILTLQEKEDMLTPVLYATVLNNSGLIDSKLGKYQNALGKYEKARELIKSNVGTHHGAYILALNNSALVYLELGLWQMAYKAFHESLKLSKEYYGVTNLEYLQILANYGFILQDARLYSDAVLNLELVKRGVEELGAYGNPLYITILGNLSYNYGSLKEFDKAREVLDLAETILDTIYENESSMYYQLMLEKGIFEMKLKNYEVAEYYYNKADSSYKDAYGPFGSRYASILADQCALNGQMRDTEAAKKRTGKLLSAIIELNKDLLPWMTEKEASAYFLENSHFNSVAASNAVLFNEPTYTEIAYNIHLASKGSIADYKINSLEQFRTNMTANDSSIWYHYQLVSKEILLINKTSSLRNEATLDSLKAVQQNLEKQLKIKDEKTQLNNQFTDISNALAKNQAVIDFASFTFSEGFTFTDSTLYIAYIIRPEQRYPEMVVLFEEGELDSIVRIKTPNTLYATRGAEDVNANSLVTSSEELYKLVWKPLEPYLIDTEEIFISANGKLNQIAFAALTDATNIQLVNRYKLTQIYNTNHLVKQNKQPENAPALLVGGIEYDYTPTKKDMPVNIELDFYNPNQLIADASRSGNGSSWIFLPGTESEVTNLYSLYDKLDKHSAIINKGEATESWFKNLDDNSPKVIHLATHGFFFENPKKAESTPSSLGSERTFSLAEDPLMRSGIIMAHANYAWQNGSNPYEEEDGILTAYEISHMNLENTDLVVLSACETGLGDIEGNEGVYGLQRAFRMAGVDYLMMSLWNVPDRETAEFMELFYGYWLGGKPIRDAFIQTQRDMADRYADEPVKWAGFVLLE